MLKKFLVKKKSFLFVACIIESSYQQRRQDGQDYYIQLSGLLRKVFLLHETINIK